MFTPWDSSVNLAVPIRKKTYTGGPTGVSPRAMDRKWSLTDPSASDRALSMFRAKRVAGMRASESSSGVIGSPASLSASNDGKYSSVSGSASRPSHFGWARRRSRDLSPL